MDRLSLADLEISSKTNSMSKSKSPKSNSKSRSKTRKNKHLLNKTHTVSHQDLSKTIRHGDLPNPLAKTIRHGDLPNPLAKTIRHRDIEKNKKGGRRKLR